MLNQWSVDRTKTKNMFQHTFETDSYWSLAYTWLKENGIVNKIENTNNFIVTKLKYQHLINDFQFLINNSNLTFDFDTAANIVGHVFYITINELNWHYSSCKCSFFQKKYFCSHIISVAVSINLVKIPNTCKNMVNIETKPKRDWLQKTQRYKNNDWINNEYKHYHF